MGGLGCPAHCEHTYVLFDNELTDLGEITDQEGPVVCCFFPSS